MLDRVKPTPAVSDSWLHSRGCVRERDAVWGGMSRFLFCRFVLPLMVLAGVVAAIGIQLGVGVSLDSSAQTLLQSDPRNRETYDKMTSLLPETTFVLVVLEMENLFSNEGAQTVRDVSYAIMDVDGATEVKSLTHSGRPVRKGFQLDIEAFVPRSATEAEWEVLRQFTTSFPLSRNVLVSEDGRYAVLVGLFERDLPDHAAREAFRQEFIAAMNPFHASVNRLHVLAFPFLEAEGTLAVQQDLTRYALWGVVLVVAILWITFRSLPAMLFVILLEGLGAACLLGIFHVSGESVDVYTGILFPLIGGLQLTFIIHYLAVFQASCEKHPPTDAARVAFARVFPPSLIAALTTQAGLAMLALSDLKTVQGFGRLGLIAVLLVFVLTFLLPGIYGISFRRGNGGPAHDGWKGNGWLPRPLTVMIPAVLVTGVLLAGIPRMRTDIRAKEFIRPDHPIRETIELLDQDLGGVNIFQLEVHTNRRRGLQSMEVLTYMEALRAYAYTLEGVSDAYAYSQLYVALNQIWEGQVLSNGELPTGRLRLNLFSNLLNNTPLLFQDSFVDQNASRSLVILRSRDMPGSVYLEVLEEFMVYAESTKPEGVTLHPVQGLHTILEGDRALVKDQFRTLGLSAVCIAVLLAVLWRSVRLAGCVLLANLPALMTLFGVMGFVGFPLNSITVMVAAVILGIVVDDGIHLVSAYRQMQKKGESSREAAAFAVRMKLRPMACTSSILAVFLGLLALTSFPPVAHFGILSALGLGVGFLGAVLLLPSLLGLGRSSGNKESEEQTTPIPGA